MKSFTDTDSHSEACDKARSLFASAKNEQALNIYKNILLDCPDHVRALHAIGIVLHAMGNTEEGIINIRKALALKPDFADAYNNLGTILSDVWKFDEAEDCFRRMIYLEPDNDSGYKNLALLLLKMRNLDEAYTASCKALDIDPGQVANYMAMGCVFEARGDVKRAIEMYSRVCELAPKSANAHTNILFMMNLIDETTQKAVFLESRRWNRRHAINKYIRRPFFNIPVPGRRLRIGYVSGDFKLHPVSYHFMPIMKCHDRDAFELFLYSNFPKCDEISGKLFELADHWRNIESMPDERVDEMIQLDAIDILIDLAGHTASNRLLLFARKPAPIQVSWIGYFNTTGMTAMDYLISDAVTLPHGEESWFSEQVVRLPNGRFCYEPPVYAPDVATLPALKNGFVTFGSFNKLSKLSSKTIALWCSVLKSVQGSSLVLKTAALEAKSVAIDLIKRFEENGVGKDRIEFRIESSHPEMLSQYGDIDIALDTFPFNGGATTCEALWMGVPVVTLSGKTPISRQSASLLASCDLSQMVASTMPEFVQIAQGLAADIKKLAEIRGSLRERLSNSLLCNGVSFTRNLEQSFREMWHSWCAGHQYTAMTKIHPAISSEVYYNAGNNNMEEKNYASAVALFKLAVRKNPGFAEAHNNLGICLFNLGKDYHEQSVISIKRAIRLKPDFGDAYNNLGKILTEMRRLSQAVKICSIAVDLMPDNPVAYLNMGTACREKGRYLEALESYEIAAELEPSDAVPLSMIAGLKLSNGDPVGAIEYLIKARELQSDNPGIQSNLLFAMNYVYTYSQKDIFDESCAWDTRYGENSACLDFSDRFNECGRLRIGYVSSDFQQHPVGVYIQAVMHNHDKNQFEIFCYDNGSKEDDVNREIRRFSEKWRDIDGMSDDDLQRLIQQDHIDILVDLSGHTGGNRLGVFSRRAAPVQVSWLGYFNTTGLANMDYVISDNDTVPPGCEQWYRETVIRMPDNRFCYTPPVICPDVEQLPALKNGYVTFGCFNNIAKLTPEVIEVWSAILKKLPESKLVLKWKTLNDSAIRDYYRMLFSIHGIPRRRIEFRGQSPLFMMRDEYNDIDIALDPFPFNGGLTSCEALWMGVPVITLAGERPVSRQTTGFLKVIGLGDLASESTSGYVECAVNLSGELVRLAAIRDGLRDRMKASPLCDAVKFTRKLEDIYRHIWQRWRNTTGKNMNRTPIDA